VLKVQLFSYRKVLAVRLPNSFVNLDRLRLLILSTRILSVSQDEGLITTLVIGLVQPIRLFVFMLAFVLSQLRLFTDNVKQS
jgi:hypothetical protein